MTQRIIDMWHNKVIDLWFKMNNPHEPLSKIKRSENLYRIRRIKQLLGEWK
jgi:hypothetical protein